MLAYGFKPVGPDGVMFRLDCGTEKLIVSLYVDDSVCATVTNSEKLYDEFVRDLSSIAKLFNYLTVHDLTLTSLTDSLGMTSDSFTRGGIWQFCLTVR